MWVYLCPIIHLKCWEFWTPTHGWRFQQSICWELSRISSLIQPASNSMYTVEKLLTMTLINVNVNPALSFIPNFFLIIFLIHMYYCSPCERTIILINWPTYSCPFFFSDKIDHPFLPFPTPKLFGSMSPIC